MNAGDDLAGLSIACPSPRVSVDFDSRPGVLLHAWADDVVSVGLVAKLESILLPRRRYSYIATKGIVKASYWGGFVGIAYFFAQEQWLSGTFLWSFVLVDFLFDVIHHPNIIKRGARSGGKTFWQRNADQIFLAIISAAVGAVITLVVTALSARG